MAHRGFSLRQLLAGVTLMSFVAWAVAAPSIVSCLSTVVAWGLVGAVRRGLRDYRPIGYGAAYGAAAAPTFILCFWPVFLGGYFFYDGPEDYFEDGFEVEAFVYPVIYCITYAPVGACIGALIGLVVWIIGKLVGTPERAQKTRPASDPFSSPAA